METEARIGFNRANHAEDDLRREQARAKTERNKNAPVLVLRLECPSTIGRDEIIEAVVKVTYQADASARPITFHTWVFDDDDSYQVGKLRNNVWVNHDYDAGCGYRIMDNPDVPVTVSQHEQFASSSPGEYWTTSQRLGMN